MRATRDTSQAVTARGACVAMVSARSAPSVRSPSAANHTPSAWARRNSAANRRANRVLPIPPNPVKVTRRDWDSRRRTSASSLRRPTKLVSPGGRPLVVSVDSADGATPQPSPSWVCRPWGLDTQIVVGRTHVRACAILTTVAGGGIGRRSGIPLGARVRVGVQGDACPGRHVWVADAVDRLGIKRPGLLVEWRQGIGGWEGRVVYVAQLRTGAWALVEEWTPAALLVPVGAGDSSS